MLQRFILCAKLYVKNSCNTHASACALGFLFSIIPIVMLILIVLVRFFHTTPDILFNFIDTQALFLDAGKTKELIENLLFTKKIGFFEISLSVFIIWTCQRFFLSIVTALKSIFHSKIHKKSILNAAFLFSGEILFVVSTALMLFISTLVISFFSSSLSTSPFITQFISEKARLFFISLGIKIARLLPYTILFPALICIFRFISGTKPSWFLCVFFSFLCVLAVFILQFAFSFFLQNYRYNLIYGILSRLIVLLLEVYIFFVIFLVCAQMIYVIQFFNVVFPAELYTLSDTDTNNPASAIERRVFLRKSRMIQENCTCKTYCEGSILYKKGEQSGEVLCILTGSIELSDEIETIRLGRGAFIGDLSSFLHLNRLYTAKALTDIECISLTSEHFSKSILSQPQSAQKLFSTVSAYCRSFMDEKTGF